MHMKKTIYFLLTSVLFLGGASFALADAPSLGFSCDPYVTSFIGGQAYIPTDGSTCFFTLLTLDTNTLRRVEIYKGIVGNSHLTNGGYLFPGDTGPAYGLTNSPFTAPQPGDSFFSVAYILGSTDQTYLETGVGTPPTADFQILTWYWGTPATVTADDQTITVGDPTSALTATITGFINSETLATSGITGQASCTTTAADTNTAGDYSITCTRGSLSSTKYAFDSFTGGTLHITTVPTLVPLTVTANDASMTYGGFIQVFTALLSGFVNGDTALSSTSGTPDCTTAATSASPVGTYTITCSVGTLTSQNYSFGTFFPGLFTILPAPLTVTADDQTMVSGSAVPTLMATLSGFVGGESLGTSGVTGGASCSTSATSASPAGIYPIICAVGSLAANNYTFATFIDGTLTVTAPTGPTVTITNPINNQAYEKSDSILLGVTVVDSVPIVATTTLFNGTPFNPSQPIPFFLAPLGTSTVTVTVRDANGLSATASVSFLITRPGGNQCFDEVEGWWNRGWVWTSDDFFHVLIDCSDLDHFHRDRHDLENDHNHNSDWKRHNDDISKGVRDRNGDMDKRIHKNNR